MMHNDAPSPPGIGDAAPKRAPAQADVVLAGGGLSSCLIAHRLATLRPDLAVTVIEQGERLGGNHTWSFHDSDVPPTLLDWLSPFIVHHWDHQRVVFPARERLLKTGYNSITAERLDAVIRETPGISILDGTGVETLAPEGARLNDGRHVTAPLVIDGRGFRPSPHLQLAYQKFLGLEVRLTASHGLDAPVIMDASVAQEDGYRFVYLLPFSETELLIEDTYYTDGPALDHDSLRIRIETYLADKGWTIAEVVREEDGILPITLGGDPAAFWQEAGPVPVAGLRAGLFHPVTGYSLPDAARLADLIATLPSLTSEAVHDCVRTHALKTWRHQRFYRLLNRMLFWAARPDERYKVLQRFYGLPEELIGRFYAGKTSGADRLRILAGKPPVPIGRAMASLAGRHPDGISRKVDGADTRAGPS